MIMDTHKILFRIPLPVLALFFAVAQAILADSYLVPMDGFQTDHCRAYGLVYQALLKKAPDVFWLLNYRGGSFLLPVDSQIKSQAETMGVVLETLTKADLDGILNMISEENMDVVSLETAPRIVIYLPTPRDDSGDIVARTLCYAKIPYKTIYDDEIIAGKLSEFDWLHIHHKDFTGQGHKQGPDSFDRNLAQEKGFNKVWQMKQNAASGIREFVNNGGFLFAMCSAAETVDIALAAQGIDIVSREFDGDSPDPECNSKLDFTRSFAFTDFTIFPQPDQHYSDIDVPSAGEGTRFKLFTFSAQVDPIPCLLNQDHVDEIQGFSGETTSFRKSLIKKEVTILAENSDGISVRYLMSTLGKGVFCFYGGHSPQNLGGSYEKNSPGFRLILNNVLFPSAKIRKRKT